jgi:2-polyprenyl-6-methoxyphenol hydroxylase-like FAD-dependent oxidoreductase
MNPTNVQCCVVGGGPAGMMLGYMLGRAGVETAVLEKHKDFLRDFRGDTVHPSTMQIMQDLGLLDEFLKLPHEKVAQMNAVFGDKKVTIGDFSRLKTPCPYIAFMPQWDFLNFLAAKGKAFPKLSVMMEADATGLLKEGNRVVGVQATTPQGPVEVRCTLVVGADGRHSTVRDSAGLVIEDQHAAIDVFWFRVGHAAGGMEGVAMHANRGRFVFTIDRGEYFQCAYVLAKGQADAVRARGLDAFRADVLAAAPELSDRIADVRSWDDVKLLTVSVERLKKWSAPGVLCIGDAAHTMSPVGGVGINLAVQDAVATANLLAGKLRDVTLTDSDVEQVQARREWPAKLVQSFQGMVQRRILAPVLHGEAKQTEVPLPVRLMSSSKWTQGLTAKFIGLGVRQERVAPAISAGTG